MKLETKLRESAGAGDLHRMNHVPVVADALRQAGAGGLQGLLPDGIESQVGSSLGGTELSRGQWQRVALARCLMRPTPILLLLDEPAAALDPEAEHLLFERFVTAARTAVETRAAVTLLVAHRLSTVRLADMIVVLSGGQISECGNHEELMERNGSYASLFRAQAAGYLDASTGDAGGM